MKGILVLVSSVPIVAALMQGAPSPPGNDLTGIYACEGVRPDGAVYRGLVEIVRHADTYHIGWFLSPHEQHFGLGVVSGNVLAVGYFGNLPGVVAYRIESGNGLTRLVGHWTVAAAPGRVFTETLVAVPPDDYPPAAPPPPLHYPHTPESDPRSDAPVGQRLSPVSIWTPKGCGTSRRRLRVRTRSPLRGATPT
jgi:hypothetical protein